MEICGKNNHNENNDLLPSTFEYRKYAAYRNKAELNARYIEVKKQSYERGRNNESFQYILGFERTFETCENKSKVGWGHLSHSNKFGL